MIAFDINVAVGDEHFPTIDKPQDSVYNVCFCDENYNIEFYGLKSDRLKYRIAEFYDSYIRELNTPIYNCTKGTAIEIWCTDELDLLTKVLDKINDVKRQFGGWNVINFDYIYLLNRYKEIAGNNYYCTVEVIDFMDLYDYLYTPESKCLDRVIKSDVNISRIWNLNTLIAPSYYTITDSILCMFIYKKYIQHKFEKLTDYNGNRVYVGDRVLVSKIDEFSKGKIIDKITKFGYIKNGEAIYCNKVPETKLIIKLDSGSEIKRSANNVIKL